MSICPAYRSLIVLEKEERYDVSNIAALFIDPQEERECRGKYITTNGFFGLIIRDQNRDVISDVDPAVAIGKAEVLGYKNPVIIFILETDCCIFSSTKVA